jgi:hypothetical protein
MMPEHETIVLRLPSSPRRRRPLDMQERKQTLSSPAK